MGRPTTKKVGDKYGGLEITKIISQNKSGRHVKVECLCHHCGQTTTMNSHFLQRRNSCGCQQRNSKSWKHAGPKTIPWQLSFGEASRRRLEYSYKRSAKKRNLEFTLESNDFTEIIVDECFYCGEKCTQKISGLGKTSGDFYYTGIDRLDSSKGYTKENCVPCCWMCNNMKSNYSKENFINQIEKIYHKMWGKK